jgi:hypothetical protein
MNHRIDSGRALLGEREDGEMVQPTGGYLRETGSARSFHRPTSKNPNNDNFRKIKTIPANGERPSVRMSALRQAMASADVRLAIENLDDSAADSFEQRLEAELGRRPVREDDTERDQRKIEQVNAELDRACREIAREAQINLRIGQLMNERDKEVRTEPGPAKMAVVARKRQRRFTAASAARRMMLLATLAAIVGGGWAAKDSQIADQFTHKIAQADIFPAIAATMTGDGPRTAPEADPISTVKTVNSVEPAVTEEDWRSGLNDRMGPAAQTPARTQEAESSVKPARIVPPSNSLPVIRSNARPVNTVRIVRAVPEPADAPAETRKVPVPTEETVSVAAPAVGDINPEREAEATANEPVGSRQPETVEIALNSARGLETLNDEQRDALKQRLVQGECLADALGSVFVRVPILTMRDLVRQLNGTC